MRFEQANGKFVLDDEIVKLCESFRDTVEEFGEPNDKIELKRFTIDNISNIMRQKKYTPDISTDDKRAFLMKTIAESYDFSEAVLSKNKRLVEKKKKA